MTFDDAKAAYEKARTALHSADMEVAFTSREIGELQKQLDERIKRQNTARVALRKAHAALMEATKEAHPLPWQCEHAKDEDEAR